MFGVCVWKRGVADLKIISTRRVCLNMLPHTRKNMACVFEGPVERLARYVIICSRREQHEFMFWAFLPLFKGHSSDILRFTASCG